MYKGTFIVETRLAFFFLRRGPQVLPLADVLTPNQFEVEQLAGTKVASFVDDSNTDIKRFLNICCTVDPNVRKRTINVSLNFRLKVTGDADAQATLRFFHSRGVRTVVVTSLDYVPDSIGVLGSYQLEATDGYTFSITVCKVLFPLHPKLISICKGFVRMSSI